MQKKEAVRASEIGAKANQFSRLVSFFVDMKPILYTGAFLLVKKQAGAITHFASPKMLRQILHLRAFIRTIFTPFLYKFDPHAHPTCSVQMSGFD